MNVSRNRSISVKLFKTVFVIYFSLTFLMTGVHVVVEYLHTKTSVLGELRKIEETFSPVLQQVLWRFDEQQLQLIAESIHKLPVIVGISVVNNEGEILAIYGQIADGNNADGQLNHRFDVSHDFSGKPFHLGNVTFQTSNDVILARVEVGFLMILLNAAIKSAVLVGLLFWAFKRILRKPLESFLEQLLDFDLNDIGSQRLRFSSSEGFEFQQLEKRFNTLLDKLALQKQCILEQERNQQQELEIKVKENTQELLATNALLSKEIEERDRAEQELLESEKRVRGIVSNLEKIGLGLLIIDQDYKVRFMNKALTEIFGEQTGGFCYKVLGVSDGPCVKCRLQEVLQENRVVHYQPTLPDGKTFDVVATPITNNDNTISQLTIIRDITQQVEQEQIIIADTRKQEQLRNLESLKTMAGAIAHRFNNAMMAVQGNLELLKISCTKDSDELQMVEDAAKAASGASQVGTMLLSYVGQNPKHQHKFSLIEVAKDSVEEVTQLIDTDIALNLIPPKNELTCIIDYSQIKKVLENVITNAVESLEGGKGAVEISFGIQFCSVNDFPIPFQGENVVDGNYVYCQIKDSGHGISAENLSRIFDPFYTTRFVGRGLGLALTVGIMQSHDGAITVASKPGKETIFRVLFPALPEAEPLLPQDDAAKEAEERVELSGNILLADDEEMILEVGRKMLEVLGFTVYTARNGNEAVGLVRDGSVQFRCVVLDISMPEKDGIEAMGEIKGIISDLPVLLSSGYSKEEFSFGDTPESGPDGFLSKPFQLVDIQNCLKDILT